MKDAVRRRGSRPPGRQPRPPGDHQTGPWRDARGSSRCATVLRPRSSRSHRRSAAPTAIGRMRIDDRRGGDGCSPRRGSAVRCMCLRGWLCPSPSWRTGFRRARPPSTPHRDTAAPRCERDVCQRMNDGRLCGDRTRRRGVCQDEFSGAGGNVDAELEVVLANMVEAAGPV